MQRVLRGVFVLVIVSFFLPTAVLAGKSGAFRPFSFENDHFSAQFPSKPTEDRREFPLTWSRTPLYYHLYTAEEPGELYYSVGVSIYPSGYDTSNPDASLTEAVRNLLGVFTDYQLVSSKRHRVGKLEALSYHLVKGNRLVKGRIIMNGLTFYHLSVDGPTSLPAKTITTFLNGFRPIR